MDTCDNVWHITMFHYEDTFSEPQLCMYVGLPYCATVNTFDTHVLVFIISLNGRYCE